MLHHAVVIFGLSFDFAFKLIWPYTTFLYEKYCNTLLNTIFYLPSPIGYDLVQIEVQRLPAHGNYSFQPEIQNKNIVST